MIDFYYWTTPNGHKVTMFLEESGLDYNIKPINISKGEQFAPDFLKIAPNNRIPAIVDHAPVGGGEPICIFESALAKAATKKLCLVLVREPASPKPTENTPGPRFPLVEVRAADTH